MSSLRKKRERVKENQVLTTVCLRQDDTVNGIIYSLCTYDLRDRALFHRASEKELMNVPTLNSPVW